MQLWTAMNIIVPLVLIIGTSSVTSQSNIGRCTDDLVSNLQDGMQQCEAARLALKCIAKETNLHKVELSYSELQQLESQIVIQFYRMGIYGCSLDLDAILDELKREEELGIEQSTKKPATFATAETIGECVAALTNAGVNGGGITCSLARDYTKCAIRVLKFVEENPSSQDIQDFEDSMDVELRKQGLSSCELNVQGLVDELRGEGTDNVEVTDKPTEKPTDKPTEKPVEVTETTSKNPPTFKTAQSIDECTNVLRQMRGLTCSDAKDALRCYIRVTPDLESGRSSEKIKALEDYLNNILRTRGLSCDLDFQGMIDEERNGGRNAGILSSPFNAVFMTATTVLSVFVARYLL